MSLQFSPTAFVGGDGEVDFFKSFYIKKNQAIINSFFLLFFSFKTLSPSEI